MIKKMINFFKTRKILNNALAAAKAGDVRNALELLQPIFCSDDLNLNFKTWKATWDTFGGIAAFLEELSLSESSIAVADQWNNVPLLEAFSFELVQHGLYHAAIPIIKRGLKFEPEHAGLLFELANVYEELRQYDQARAQLLSATRLLEESFMARYLVVFYSIMIGDMTSAKEWYNGLIKILSYDVSDYRETYENLYSALEIILERTETLSVLFPFNDGSLFEWNAAINGNILLHSSKEGMEVMNGRYAWLQEPPHLLFNCIAQLKSLLEHLKVKPQRLIALPDHDSNVLAFTAAKVFNCPVVTLSEETKSFPGLIVCYHSELISDAIKEQISEAHESQIFWCHSVDWTKDSIAPDFISYFAQYTCAPWAVQKVIDSSDIGSGNTPRVIDRPAMTGTYQEIVEKLKSIVSEEQHHEESSHIKKLASKLYCLEEERQSTVFDLKRYRTKQWTASPVSSNRF